MNLPTNFGNNNIEIISDESNTNKDNKFDS